MAEIKVGKATVEELFTVLVGDPVDGGTVTIYIVKSDNNDLPFKDFYIATFYGTDIEVVWGAGSTIMDALKDAEMEWDREEGEYDNPFREALEKENLEELDVLGLAGEVTVKEVLVEPVRDGRVFVYKIENDNNDEENDDDEDSLFDDFNPRFEDFYIATFSSTRGEAVWGEGSGIESALEDAERNWDRAIEEYGCYGEGEGECTNPFREAIKALEKMEKSKEKEEGNNNILLNY